MGYLNFKYLYQGYPMDILFQSARAPCRLESLAAPSGPGCHGPLRAIVCHCYAPLLSLSHRQAPKTRFAPFPPKLPQPLVDLIHVASPGPSCPTRRLHLQAHVETWRSCAGGADVGLEYRVVLPIRILQPYTVSRR